LLNGRKAPLVANLSQPKFLRQPFATILPGLLIIELVARKIPVLLFRPVGGVEILVRRMLAITAHTF
jgi:hypothetical protein